MYRIISEVPLYIVILIFIIMVDHVLVFGQSPPAFILKGADLMELPIVSQNVAGWSWRLSKETYTDRLKRILIDLKAKDCFITSLQEVQLSGGKYLSLIREVFPEKEYELILPKAYTNQPKSVVSLMIIKKEYCDSYSVSTLEGLEDSLRYNYVTINTPIEGLCFRVLNVNVPHNTFDYSKTAAWYREKRVELRKRFLQRIKELAETYRREPDLKLVITADMNMSYEDPYIQKLAYSYDSPMLDAVKECDRTKITWNNQLLNGSNRIDYILYSRAVISERGGLKAKYTVVDDTPIVDKKSDHCYLVGGLVL
jgi:exonuclease III